jgi:hypothetical protein
MSEDTAFFSSEDLSEIGGLFKNALILVEGTHTDNAKKVHKLPADRLFNIVRNTNRKLSQGAELPVMVEHSRTLFDKHGNLARIGEVVSPLEYRTITDQHLLGKFGIFAKVKIDHLIDEVRSKKIKKLSPGLNLEQETIDEISAVAFPAILGPALFSRYGETNYLAAKEAAAQSLSLKEKMQECFDIFFDVILAINAVTEEQATPVEINNQKITAIGDFVGDLQFLLKIEAKGEEEKNVYDNNSYAENIVHQRQNFNKDEGSPPAVRAEKQKIANFRRNPNA